MKKAIQIAYDRDFEKKCRIAHEAGFEHISVNFHDMTDRSAEAWAKAPETILRILSENRLTCVQSHAYYYDLRLSAEITDEERERDIRNAVRVTGEIGGKYCVYHPRTAVNDGYRSSAALEINKRTISGYLECAVKADTSIALENLPVFHGIVPVMPFYSSDYGDLIELYEALKCENLAVCWDTGHANLMAFDQAKAVRALGPRIRCTHLHNNFGMEDEHLPVDDGTVDWESVMRAFRDTGYDGPLTLETHCRYADDALLSAFAAYNLEGLKYLERMAGA